MGSVNKWIGIGNLGADVELKYTASGKAVANLRIACSETWKDKQGQKQERTEWVRIVVWGDQAENCSKYLSKGRSVYIEGRLQTRSYDKDGQKHYATDIVADRVVFLGGGGGSRDGDDQHHDQRNWGGGNRRGGGKSAPAPQGDRPSEETPETPPSDDEIPF